MGFWMHVENVIRESLVRLRVLGVHTQESVCAMQMAGEARWLA